MKKIKIGITGATGKMGKAIVNLINNPETQYSSHFVFIGGIDSNHHSQALEKLCLDTDIILDFSHADCTLRLMDVVKDYNNKLIIGTTGLQDFHLSKIEQLSQKIAILYAPNTSIGANLVASLAAQAAKLLKQYDVEIIESHHKFKKDAPSGTALMMGQKIADSQGIDFKKHAIFDRANKGLRKKHEIGFSSIRGGGIFGDNKIIFAGDYEVVTMNSSALSRDAFASGALYAAQWINSKSKGLYHMDDVLDLNNLNYN